jgi:AraC-like DNA-binding protein
MVRRKTEPLRGMLRTGAVPGRCYRHARYYPSADLEPYVEHYWAVERDLRGLATERVETLAHPSVHLIFQTGTSRVTGPMRARFSRLLDGKDRIFAVKFRPGGFRPFVRFPVSRLADTTLSIRQVFGPKGNEVDRAVLAEPTDSARISVVEEFLRARRPAVDGNVSRVAEMVSGVVRHRDIRRVRDLAARYQLNTRTLERLFAHYVGVSPKWVIQRYRLHEAAERLAPGAPILLADLALELGYTDQSHFARDFKAMVGFSPAAYARLARRRDGLA